MTGTLLTAGAHTRRVAKMLADELGDSPIPATTLLERHLSAQRETTVTLRLKVTGPTPHPGVRKPTDDEKGRLGAPGIAQCKWRTGVLYYDLAEIAAVTTLMWLPARLTYDADRDLADGDVPAGKALPRMQRADQRAMALSPRMSELHPADGLPDDLDDLDIAVTASAVLIVDGRAAAIATERIPRDFISLLAGQD